MSKFLIKKIITNVGPLPLIQTKSNRLYKKINNSALISFGKLNKNKYFYVIKRSPGAGMFSNLTFVMNHLLIAHNHNLIPVIDMENFPTIYNEKKKIDGTYNSWEYFFNPVSKYTLDEVYKSKNVFITSNRFEETMYLDLFHKKFIDLKYKIKIKKNLNNEFLKLKKKIFLQNKKILGVHFRGTTYKIAKGHAFPLNKKLMRENIDKLISKYKYDKIFLVTEELEYLKYLKKIYGDKIINVRSFKSKKIDAFKIYPRKNHRYLLGKEIIIETLLLANCDGITYVKSNVSSAAIFFSNKKKVLHPLFLGFNSRNKFIARWLWYIKNLLPRNLYGLKLKN